MVIKKNYVLGTYFNWNDDWNFKKRGNYDWELQKLKKKKLIEFKKCDCRHINENRIWKSGSIFIINKYFTCEPPLSPGMTNTWLIIY